MARDWPPWMWGAMPQGQTAQTFTLGGWRCPGCQRCWSPSVLLCEFCVPDTQSTGPAVHLGTAGGPGPEHDLCVPPSQGGLCEHAEEDEEVCRGGRHCSC